MSVHRFKLPGPDIRLIVRFADRDMFMRFLGIGVGHCGQHLSPHKQTIQMDNDTLTDNEVDSQNNANNVDEDTGMEGRMLEVAEGNHSSDEGGSKSAGEVNCEEEDGYLDEGDEDAPSDEDVPSDEDAPSDEDVAGYDDL